MNKILSILFIATVLFACTPPADNTSESAGEQPAFITDPNTATTPSEAAPAANTADVAGLQNLPAERKAHYTCPEFHPGSGGDAAGKCPVCGKDYVHNDVFHQLEGANATPAKTITVDPNQPSSGQPPIQINQSTPTAGKGFHFVCPDGHAGGAEAQAKCATCGKDLVHNDGYH
jgi:hypothetical protein